MDKYIVNFLISYHLRNIIVVPVIPSAKGIFQSLIAYFVIPNIIDPNKMLFAAPL